MEKPLVKTADSDTEYMSKSFKRFFLSILILVGASSVADIELENKAYWLCKNKKEVRTIRVQISGSGVCSTLYSKEGSEKIVGSGKNHDSCINILNNVRTNLEKSNWACRDISATRITASAGE